MSPVLESHQYIETVFSDTIKPIELKFHMKTPYDKFAKMYTNCCGHMTKVTDILIYGKKPFKNLHLQNHTADDLGTWYVIFEMCGLPSLFK